MLARITSQQSRLLRPLAVRHMSGDHRRALSYASTCAHATHHSRSVEALRKRTKMTEVRAWVNESNMPASVRAETGVKDVEFSFCPGEGWLAAWYIFNDLDDMVGTDALEKAKKAVSTAPHYDSSREVHEFKGFYLKEV
ncbi:hypothetical protein EMIHUDRAFT_449302 [Emiliania huxleyi CCMP1516]|uniref:Uncharacterized protein n=2 Tax=Emiliania huxleyi TaxID=2903 RepID=A0A0D3KEN4_EMIH1|nr:hypothetical protein EMIHUDRAFT_449302 [Emiliania huxleyi CCMP1516]EOD34219.1 hypothetical protein EMIHUDRAFT_449302 [Emiliania huxleyi CCMP1516]|eukprot:XP_005786648.1 hypothetical protein EMIHUDRAFT_449302 [Emiliania huxleyi CCMP1516]